MVAACAVVGASANSSNQGDAVVARAAAQVGRQGRGERQGVVAVAEVGLDAGGAGADRLDALGDAAGAEGERGAGVGDSERRAGRGHRDRVVLAGGGGEAERVALYRDGRCLRG